MTGQDPTRPTLMDAAARSVVRLPDGRTGRLVYVPGPRSGERRRNGRRNVGTRARVLLPSGRYVSVAVEDLVVVSQAAEGVG